MLAKNREARNGKPNTPKVTYRKNLKTGTYKIITAIFRKATNRFPIPVMDLKGADGTVNSADTDQTASKCQMCMDVGITSTPMHIRCPASLQNTVK